MSNPIPIESMTTEEKLHVMELLWDDLRVRAGETPAPTWHQEVLQAREDSLEQGMEATEDWEEAKKRIRNDGC